MWIGEEHFGIISIFFITNLRRAFRGLVQVVVVVDWSWCGGSCCAGPFGRGLLGFLWASCQRECRPRHDVVHMKKRLIVPIANRLP
jgi:hypothetical protein